jgi:hypothetical protein
LVRNDAVAPEAIAEGGFLATADAARGCGELLAVEDTTVLSYGHAVAEQLGDLGGKAESAKRGYWVHSVLLLERQSARTVGLIEQQRWCRAGDERGQRHRRAQRAYEDKESFKWQRASERMAQRLGETMARAISVCDREADVYRYLRYKHAQGQRFIVRAVGQRRVDAEGRYLLEALEQAPVLGAQRVALAQRGGQHARRARTAHLEVRAVSVTLRAPKRAPALGTLEVNAILAREPSPARGEEALQWLLFTSEPIETLAAATRVLGDYGHRWRIEDFHKRGRAVRRLNGCACSGRTISSVWRWYVLLSRCACCSCARCWSFPTRCRTTPSLPGKGPRRYRVRACSTRPSGACCG